MPLSYKTALSAQEPVNQEIHHEGKVLSMGYVDTETEDADFREELRRFESAYQPYAWFDKAEALRQLQQAMETHA